MIKLQVEDYCHDCLAFEAAVNVEKETLYSHDEAFTVSITTVIRCKNQKRCATMIQYLKNQTKIKNSDI